MVTLETADNALKNYYLDAVTTEIDAKVSPFLAMIEKTSAYVSGKGVTKVIRTGLKGGMGAGTETGKLPTARANEYLTLQASLKNLYGTIEISDKALRASANADGAFVNLLNDEMQALVESARDNFSRMLFGNGSGVIGTVRVADVGLVTLRDMVGGRIGEEINFCEDGEIKYGPYRIYDVDKETQQLYLNDFKFDDYDVVTGMEVMLANTVKNGELTGLSAIFGNNPIYGQDRTKPVMCPYREYSIGDISEDVIVRAIDNVESASGGKINLIICSRAVRRELLKHFRANQVAFTMGTAAGGASAIIYNGIPIVVDEYCPMDAMYLLDTTAFKLCQLADWQWIEGESGKILKQIPGTPTYTATLVKYAELLCEKPNAQGMLKNINVEY